MQIQDLNKNQIVLLVLLISFVTSIATGIITTSLLQEAPLEVTRNINRIVEKTVETVTIPGTVISTPREKEITTVIIKEEDLIIDSINKNIKSVVRIKEKDAVLLTSSFYGMGLVVSKDGLIAADRKTITPNNAYIATMSDGVELFLIPQGLDKQTNFVLFKAGQLLKVVENMTEPLTASANLAQAVKSSYVFMPAIFSDKEPQLGQTLISLGGEKENSVAVGRIVSLDMKTSGTGSTTVKYISSINTDIASRDLIDGSPVFNLSGDVAGLQLSLDDSKSFTPVSILKKELTTLMDSAKSQ